MSEAARRAQELLESDATERLLADVQRLGREIDEGQQVIAAERERAGVKPGEPLLGIFKEHGMPTGQETRVIDPNTGAAKGSKLARFDLIPEDVMELLAKHYGRGARKYEDRNWEKGYKWSLSYAAMRRHMAAFWQGEDVDPDPALYTVDDIFSEEEYRDDPALHIVAALWHAIALTAFSTRGIGTDDRPSAAA